MPPNPAVTPRIAPARVDTTSPTSTGVTTQPMPPVAPAPQPSSSPERG
jgi:hypothetical protein